MDDVRARLAAEDWALVSELPCLVVAAAANIEHDGGVGSTREIVAGLRAIVDGGESFLGNSLIQAVFEAYKADGQGEARTLALSSDPPPEIAASAIALCTAVSGMIAPVADEPDSAQFRSWIYGLADEVVSATHTGGFLGIGGRKVTAAETQFLADLEHALDLTTDAETS